MPRYYRRNNARRSYRRATTYNWPKKRRGWSSLFRYRKVARMRPEYKYQDYVDDTSFLVNNGGSMNLLNGIGTGTGPNQRIGMKIKVDKIQIRGRVRVNPDAAAVPSRCRFFIVMDRVNDNATTPPSFGELFNFLPSSAPAGSATSAFYNLYNTSKYKFLYDKTFVVYPNGGQECGFDINVKVPNCITSYNNSAATQGSIDNKALWFGYFGDVNYTDTTQAPIVNYSVRIRYYDQ